MARIRPVNRFTITRTLVFFALLAGSAASPAQQVIRITSVIAPPITTEDATGIYDLLVREIFQRIGGYQLQLENHEVARDIAAVNDGLADGVTVRVGGLTETYPNVLQVPESLDDYEFTGFSKRADIRISDWDSLQPYNVAYPATWLFYQRHVRAKSALHTRTLDQLFDLLDQNRVDIALFGKLVGLYQVKQRGIADVNVVELPNARIPVYTYFNKQHAALVPQVAAALRAMKQDGSYREIYNSACRRYLGDDAALLK
jgi:polar amino acid transport system substrate-binding protein